MAKCFTLTFDIFCPGLRRLNAASAIDGQPSGGNASGPAGRAGDPAPAGARASGPRPWATGLLPLGAMAG